VTDVHILLYLLIDYLSPHNLKYEIYPGGGGGGGRGDYNINFLILAK